MNMKAEKKVRAALVAACLAAIASVGQPQVIAIKAGKKDGQVFKSSASLP